LSARLGSELRELALACSHVDIALLRKAGGEMDATMEPPNRRPPPEVVAARKAEIAKRYKRRRKGGAKPSCASRIRKQLAHVLIYFYGLAEWPDADDVRDNIELLVNYDVMAGKDPRPRLALHASWLLDNETERLIASAQRFPVAWKPAELGRKIGLTAEVRERCEAWNIWPVDRTPAECRRRSREKYNAKRRNNPKPMAAVATNLATAREQAILTALDRGEVAMADLVRLVAKERCFKKLTEPRFEVRRIIDRLKARGVVDDRDQPSNRAPIRIVWKAQKP
jgi:hypothetical protein